MLGDIGDDAANLAQRAGLDQLAGVNEMRHPVALVGHPERKSAVGGEFEQIAGVVRRDDHRFLHQDMEPALEAGARLFIVVAMGRADQHGVRGRLVEHGAPVGGVRDLDARLVHE